MPTSDQIRFVAYGVLLNGFLYGLTTYLFDIFNDLFTLNITNGTVAPLTVQIMEMIQPFIKIGPLFCLIFLAVMGILVANARSEKLSPYFGINAWGILTYYSSICVAVVLIYVVSILDMIIMDLSKIFAVPLGGDWDYTKYLAMGFNIMNWVVIAIVVLAAVYVVVNSVSIESKQQVV